MLNPVSWNVRLGLPWMAAFFCGCCRLLLARASCDRLEVIWEYWEWLNIHFIQLIIIIFIVIKCDKLYIFDPSSSSWCCSKPCLVRPMLLVCLPEWIKLASWTVTCRDRTSTKESALQHRATLEGKKCHCWKKRYFEQILTDTEHRHRRTLRLYSQRHMTIMTHQAPPPIVHSPCREGTQMLDIFTWIDDWIARNWSNQEIVEAN